MTEISWIKAQVHWETFGYKEKRDYNCETKPFVCALEGHSCNCPNGFVHYAKTSHNVGMGSTPDNFQNSM